MHSLESFSSYYYHCYNKCYYYGVMNVQCSLSYCWWYAQYTRSAFALLQKLRRPNHHNGHIVYVSVGRPSLAPSMLHGRGSWPPPLASMGHDSMTHMPSPTYPIHRISCCQKPSVFGHGATWRMEIHRSGGVKPALHMASSSQTEGSIGSVQLLDTAESEVRLRHFSFC